MNDSTSHDSEETFQTSGQVSFDEERAERVSEYVKTNSDYYVRQFKKIGSKSEFVWTFNLWAGLLGPVWFAARGLWNWALSFLIIETFAFVQIFRGLFGDLASAAWERIAKIEGTLELRQQQLAAAIEKGTDKIDVYQHAKFPI